MGRDCGAAAHSPLLAQAETPADYTIRIAQLRLEIAPGKTVKTTGFNGRVPGELIRLREGQQVTIDVVNETDMADMCIGTGSTIPSLQDQGRRKKGRRSWRLMGEGSETHGWRDPQAFGGTTRT